jgi:hypothetical protein
VATDRHRRTEQRLGEHCGPSLTAAVPPPLRMATLTPSVLMV